MTSTAAGAAIIAYFLGSIPFGLVVARAVARVDIRRAGSGNIGATNVARTLGSKWGVLVLVLDALKGLLSVALVPLLFLPVDAPEFGRVRVICGLAAMVGHMMPCWLKFRGGTGVATALGVIAVLGWPAALAAGSMFAVVFAATRIVSLSSILASITFGACQFLIPGYASFTPEKWSLALFSVLAPLLVIVRHHSNIARLLRGEEPKFRSKNVHSDSERGTEENGANEN